MTGLCLITILSVYMSNKPNGTGVISSKQSDPHLTSPAWRHTDHLDRWRDRPVSRACKTTSFGRL